MMSEFSFTILGIIVDIVSLGVAMYIFVVTSRLEREATEEQTHRECVRATLSELAELRRAHPNFKSSLEKADDKERIDLIRAYVSDLERFAVGCNAKAYDIEIVNKMSGGLLLKQYKNYFKPYIDKKRSAPTQGEFVKNDTLYIEIEEMMENLLVLREKTSDDLNSDVQ